MVNNRKQGNVNKMLEGLEGLIVLICSCMKHLPGFQVNLTGFIREEKKIKQNFNIKSTDSVSTVF